MSLKQRLTELLGFAAQPQAEVSSETLYFESEDIWFSNLLLILFGGVLSFKEFVGENYIFSLGIILFVIFWAFIRLFFKARSPTSITISLSTAEVIIKQHYPKIQPRIINIKTLKKTLVHIPISRFPMAIVELHFECNKPEKILFNLENKNNRFFSIPQENKVPETVVCFINALDLYIKNRGL